MNRAPSSRVGAKPWPEKYMYSRFPGACWVLAAIRTRAALTTPEAGLGSRGSTGSNWAERMSSTFSASRPPPAWSTSQS